MPPLDLEHETAHRYLMKHDEWYSHCWWLGWDDLCEHMRVQYLWEQQNKKVENG